MLGFICDLLFPCSRLTKSLKISWRFPSLSWSNISRRALWIWSHLSWLTGRCSDDFEDDSFVFCFFGVSSLKVRFGCLQHNRMVCDLTEEHAADWNVYLPAKVFSLCFNEHPSLKNRPFSILCCNGVEPYRSPRELDVSFEHLKSKGG